jgi:nitrate/nitrite transporter NarK
MALYLRHPVAVMVPVVIAAMGIFAALPVFWALPSRFLTGAAAAAGIGLINSLGNLGGFAAPYATGALEDLTGTNKAGMWAVGILLVLGSILVVWLRGEPAS